MPANFEGRVPRIDPDDAVMLLIDHQSGLFNTVRDLDLRQLRANAITLAKVATLAKMPVITTASVPQGPNGPLIPEIHQVAPHAQYVARKGQINSWDNPDFVAAVKATGKKQLIIAGTITSVCMAFPAISAIAEGYKFSVWSTLPGPIQKWQKKSRLPVLFRQVPCRWIQQPSVLKSSALGTVLMQKNGPKLMKQFSQNINC